MRPLGFYFLLKFQPLFCFAGLRVGSRLHPQLFSGKADAPRRPPASFPHARPCALPGSAFLSAASGGSSSAVNSSLEGRFGSPSAAPRLFLLGFLGFCRLLENAAGICCRAGASGVCPVFPRHLYCQPPNCQSQTTPGRRAWKNLHPGAETCRNHCARNPAACFRGSCHARKNPARFAADRRGCPE